MLPKDPGMCKAYYPRYFYNVETDQCELFGYGGCGGIISFFIYRWWFIHKHYNLKKKY